MQTINIPFGRSSIPLHVSEENLKAVITDRFHRCPTDRSESELVKEALNNPISSLPLHELAVGKKRVSIVTSDHTRAVPSRITLPLLLGEIRQGNPEAEINIVIATGLHRAPTDEELRRMFGDEIVDKERIVINNAFCPEDFVDMGTLPSGAAFHVNRAVVECDLLITEGLIEPHFFAGFSGGCKSVLPGVCSAATVNENHSYKALANPKATTGVIHGNPVHEDMVRAAQLVNVGFILNVVLNEEKKVVAAFSGNVTDAHEKGIEFLKGYSLCEAVEGDIVITSNGGYPLDQNLYQAPKSAATAQCCAGKDGVIILCAGCADGMGGENFKKYLSSGTIEEIDALLRTYEPSQTPAETWCVQILCRILRNHKLILVSTLDRELVEKCNMIPAVDLDEAMEKAYAIKGSDAKVVVIPDGVAALIIKEEH